MSKYFMYQRGYVVMAPEGAPIFDTFARSRSDAIASYFGGVKTDKTRRSWKRARANGFYTQSATLQVDEPKSK